MPEEPSIAPPVTIREAFRYCQEVVRHHYENFPVGSFAARRQLRPYIHSIYAFARHADDIADEGSESSATRLVALEEWQHALNECFAGRSSHPVFIALGETVKNLGLPQQPFDDLLRAFRMDARNTAFETYEDLLAYCRCSANPVGRLVLMVFGCLNEQTIPCSDMLCTALQLTNFWQDVGRDVQKGRIYLPLEDFRRFEYTALDLRNGIDNPRLRGMIAFEVERTRTLFASAQPLFRHVPPRLRLELALTWHGGMSILDKIEQREYDVIGHRPVITPRDKPGLLLSALRTSL